MTGPFLTGRARVFGDDINTDYIITSRRKRESLDPQVLRRYLFEEIDPNFAATVEPGDLIVAGKNFGCGSAMEVAATVVLGAGIRAVLARTYFRNAVNNGLFPIVCDTARFSAGDRLSIVNDSVLQIRNETSGETVSAEPVPRVMMDILACGGLVPYIIRNGNFRI